VSIGMARADAIAGAVDIGNQAFACSASCW
jgi:hypothetical protein